MHPARRISARSAVAPFYVMSVVEAVARRRDAGLTVLSLGSGEPGAGTPKAVLDAAHRALDGGGGARLGYTPSLGLPDLRSAIAGHYARTYGVDVSPANVVVTTGSSVGFLLAFLAAFDAGDQVVLARPGYPAYRNILAAYGCEVVEVPTGVADGYRLSTAMLDALPSVPAGVMVAGPANPTGTMIPAAEMASLANWCDARGVRFISDEIYHGISYVGPAASALQTTRSAIVVNSFSKYFCMTGWRVGWLVLPDELVGPVDSLTGNMTICPPTISQYAALAAFTCYDEMDERVHRYKENHDLVLSALHSMGISRVAPSDGAFYAYADISHLTDDAIDFSARLLDDTGVAIAPGLDFDPVGGNHFIRLSYAGPRDEVERALAAMGAWVGSRRS
jgi:aspartate/methionine/tyrosine aminotransferase